MQNPSLQSLPKDVFCVILEYIPLQDLKNLLLFFPGLGVGGVEAEVQSRGRQSRETLRRLKERPMWLKRERFRDNDNGGFDQEMLLRGKGEQSSLWCETSSVVNFYPEMDRVFETTDAEDIESLGVTSWMVLFLSRDRSASLVTGVPSPSDSLKSQMDALMGNITNLEIDCTGMQNIETHLESGLRKLSSLRTLSIQCDGTFGAIHHQVIRCIDYVQSRHLEAVEIVQRYLFTKGALDSFLAAVRAFNFDRYPTFKTMRVVSQLPQPTRCGRKLDKSDLDVYSKHPNAMDLGAGDIPPSVQQLSNLTTSLIERTNYASCAVQPRGVLPFLNYYRCSSVTLEQPLPQIQYFMQGFKDRGSTYYPLHLEIEIWSAQSLFLLPGKRSPVSTQPDPDIISEVLTQHKIYRTRTESSEYAYENRHHVSAYQKSQGSFIVVDGY